MYADRTGEFYHAAEMVPRNEEARITMFLSEISELKFDREATLRNRRILKR